MNRRDRSQTIGGGNCGGEVGPPGRPASRARGVRVRLVASVLPRLAVMAQPVDDPVDPQLAMQSGEQGSSRSQGRSQWPLTAFSANREAAAFAPRCPTCSPDDDCIAGTAGSDSATSAPDAEPNTNIAIAHSVTTTARSGVVSREWMCVAVIRNLSLADRRRWRLGKSQQNGCRCAGSDSGKGLSVLIPNRRKRDGGGSAFSRTEERCTSSGGRRRSPTIRTIVSRRRWLRSRRGGRR